MIHPFCIKAIAGEKIHDLDRRYRTFYPISPAHCPCERGTGAAAFILGDNLPGHTVHPPSGAFHVKHPFFDWFLPETKKSPRRLSPFCGEKTARTTWFCYRWSRFFNSERVVRSANSATPERATMPQAAQITEGHSTFAQPNSKNTGGSRQNPALTTK